jgi:undecaprenyl-diphosphatase
VTAFEATVLGLVQGLTEFLPVSSTAHLLFAQRLLGMEGKKDLWPEVATHLGTVLAVVVYYRATFKEMARDAVGGGKGRRTLALLVLATAMLGLVFVVHKAAPAVKEWRFQPRVAAYGLIGVGVFLLATAFVRRGGRVPSAGSAAAMGVAQCVAAIVPGCSRSGSTVGTGLFVGLDPVEAARFSFLMSVPAVLAGSLYEVVKEHEPIVASDWTPMLLSGGVAFVSGLAAIHVLLTIVGRGKLHWFGPYCVAAGVAWLAFFT